MSALRRQGSANAALDARDVALRDADLGRDVYLPNTSRQSHSDEFNLGVGQLHEPAPLAARHTALRHRIVDVIARTARAYVGRLAAWSVFMRPGRIADVARVEEHRAGRLWQVGMRQPPREGVRLNLPPWRELEDAVVGAVMPGTEPTPAAMFVGRANLRPESIDRWSFDHSLFYRREGIA